PIVVVGAFVLLMPMLDLVGDVAFYVGNRSKRRTLETAMLAIIEFVSQKAPKANLVIIGHSLGTVLVTHTAYGLAGPPAERNLFLVTLGSPLDRKSTRLNSSHEWISYAVFCLKKKT